MSYLPGVPNVGPAPISPITKIGGGGHGGATGIAKVAASAGKPNHTQNLGSIVGRRGSGMASITGGDPAMHTMNHYGKGPSALLGGSLPASGVDPTAHPGSKMVRGGSGGIKPHGYLKFGGLGPGKLGAPGQSNTNYSMTNMDPGVSMSLNIGTEAVEACKRLHVSGASDDFAKIRNALHDLVRKHANVALDTMTADTCGYARALRDMWIALESGATTTQYNQVEKPTVTEKKPNAR